MKLQRLTIHNIASIEDAVIDFENPPLADSEVFLITGKTGAGKSTILDAICLALFATTPRMKNTNMQGDTTDGGDNITIKDPRQLMRRNSGEASVSLLFTGSNGIHYEAIWSVARARKKSTGSLQPKIWQLTNLDTLDILTKDNDIKAEIKSAIGLDFNQFCRTTMLAQGEFTRFLNSKDDEKAEILEKITGVDIYSKIGAKIYAITNQKEQAWKTARQLVEGVITLSYAEIEKRLKSLNELENKQHELKNATDKVSAKRDWIKTANDLAKKFKDSTEAYNIAEKEVQSEEFQKKELTVKEWNATIDSRSWLADRDKEEKDKELLHNSINNLSKEFTMILGGRDHDSNEIRIIEKQIEEIETILSAASSKAEVYENSQTIVALLNTISSGRSAIEKINKEIATEEKSLKEVLQPIYEKSKQELEAAHELFSKDETEIKTREDEVISLNLPELRSKRDESTDLKVKITVAKERINNLATTEAKHKETKESLAKRRADIDKKIDNRNALAAPIHDAELTMKIRKETLDGQRDTIDKFAKQLRKKLTIGDICPVCRQEITSELPHEDELASLVEGLKKNYDDAEQAYKELVESQVKLNAEIIAESNAYKRDLKAYDEDKSVAEAETKALNSCRDCGVYELNETTLSTLENLKKSNDENLFKLNEAIKEGEKKENDVKLLRNALGSKRKELETLSEKMDKARNAVAECKARIATADALVKTKKAEIEDAKEKTSALIHDDNWAIDREEKPMEFANALAGETKLYNENQKKKQILTGKLETSRLNLENVENVISSILSAMPEWEKLQAPVSKKMDNLLKNANQLNTSLSTVLNRLNDTEDSLKANKKRLDSFLAEHTYLTEDRLKILSALSAEDIKQASDSLNKIREEIVAKKSLMDNARIQLSRHQNQKPSLAEDDTLESLTEKINSLDKQLSEIGEIKGALNQELKTDAENKVRLSALLKDCDNKKAEYQKWSRMNQLIGDSTGAKFRKIAQSYVLQSLIHSANSYMRTLTDRYTLKITPGTFVISLEDAYQGYVARAASTISGGESFLVSLSLALALSDIGQALSVDTLFIDEGFSTLSGEPLNNAIETLRSLHNKVGRHVGIISHVEELHERIPVQIQAQQEGNSSSSKITVITK